MAQKKMTDTTGKTIVLNEIIMTATRTEKSIGDIPVPIIVISKAQLLQTGSQKLIDILQQQTGLVLADNPLGQALQGYPNPFGSGIQLQGLDPAYTLILLDGEPLTGRNAGILNLGRVAVGNIQKIEIIKGPATSLYGSDALAGVINIITEKPQQNSTAIQLHHASNNTWGITVNNVVKWKNTTLQLFGNRFSSSGYDLDSSVYGKTSDPYHNYSFAAKLVHNFTDRTSFLTSVRLFTQRQFNNYLVYSGTDPNAVDGTSDETDWTLNNQLTHTFSEKIKLYIRFYITGYRNDGKVYLQKDNSLFDRSFMKQFLLKPEIQVEIGAKKNQKLIAGIGYNYETINANRYADQRKLNAVYFFTQKEWLLTNNLTVTVGGRFDKNSLYKVQFNPKMAIAWKPVKQIMLIGSIGTGYKAPDFRQQFLSFTNSLIGYTLLGAHELAGGLMQLQQSGQLDPSSDITPYLTSNNLVPEKSTGINTGIRYTHAAATISANFFRNDIRNLIENYQLAGVQKTNGLAVYSYKNVSKVFTQGFDIAVSYSFWHSFSVSTGYQYLVAKDKEVIREIKKGLVKRDPVTYVSSYVKLSEYGGLFNRSKHTGNLQLHYQNDALRLAVNFRATWKSRFGFEGKKDNTGKVFNNGTKILDDDRKYAPGFGLFNLNLTKKIGAALEIQLGSENLFDHTNKETLPNLPGRTYFINCNIDLQKLF